MKYPNASDGVNKIYMSEILALTASVIVVICSVIGMLCFDDPDLENLVIIMGVIIICALGLFVAGYILQIVGIVRASKDVPAFKVSVIAIVAALITTILEAVFYGNHFASFIVEIAGDVSKFFLVHYIIHGIMHISEHLERPDMIKKGNFIFRIIIVHNSIRIMLLYMFHCITVIFKEVWWLKRWSTPPMKEEQ